MRVCRAWEDGPLYEKSAGCNNVIGITPPYGDGDHINRITGASMGEALLINSIMERVLWRCHTVDVRG